MMLVARTCDVDDYTDTLLFKLTNEIHTTLMKRLHPTIRCRETSSELPTRVEHQLNVIDKTFQVLQTGSSCFVGSQNRAPAYAK